MGRFIDLEFEKKQILNNGWIIPNHLIKYDQRGQHWPNELFPFFTTINDFSIQYENMHVVIRRFCEQRLYGDIAVEKRYDTTALNWIFWFEHESDKNFFDAEYKLFITSE